MSAQMNHADAVESARTRWLVERAPTEPAGSLASYIIDSWQRCTALGFDSERDVDFDPVSSTRLRELIDRDMQLQIAAESEVEIIEKALANSNLVVILTNDQGVVVSTVGCEPSTGHHLRVAARRGVDLSEDKIGTNALGTAIVAKRSVRVRGREHFFSGNGLIDCVATPIFSPTGALIGIFDVSTEGRMLPASVLDMVRSSALRIESQILRQLPGVRCIGFHAHPEWLGSPLEGLIGIDADERIVGINSSAARIMERAHGDLVSRPLREVFDVHGRELDHLLGSAQKTLIVRSSNGVNLTVRGDGNATRRVAPAPSVQPPGSRPLAFIQTPGIHTQYSKALRAQALGLAILITGESGTGKEVLAKALHDGGRRTAGPFVAINCAAIPESLIEAELFGYSDGAFTGARRGGAKGRLLQASGGTLFLDEIGDMPTSLQARLLRVLQERVVTRLGDGEPTPVDFDLICATHRDLESKIAQEQFRADLYYRIAGLSIRLPALRDRSDLMDLADHILDGLADAAGIRAQLSAEAQVWLGQQPWPGNIRELKSRLASALVSMSPNESTLMAHHLADDETGSRIAERPQADCPEGAPTMKSVNAGLVQETVRACHGNIALAARRLGIARGTVYRYLR